MKSSKKARLLSEFSKKQPQFEDLVSTVQALLERILRQSGTTVHSIGSRVKTRESLSQKLKRPDREYDSLDQITDLAGIRIITYFEPDVNQIASIIEDEFEIQWSDSEDKRSLLDPDRFGYSSVHYIASFSEVRCALTEYRHFAGFRFEVQIRSILQHAWAEIEHDLGYKSELSIPRETRRRFSRVAGLLELADAEFTAIRSELEEYANRVAELIESEPHRVLVDKVSLGTFLSLDSVGQHLDLEIAALKNVVVIDHPEYLEVSVRRLKYFGISTIGELIDHMEGRQEQLLAFARIWLKSRPPFFTRGVSIFYLALIWVAETHDSATIRDYAVQFEFTRSDPDDFAARLIHDFDSANEQLGGRE